MGTQNEGGFTIIEVILFLAISGMLLLGILAATGGAVSTARFTDTLKSTESFVQRQYDQVITGVNSRSDSAAESCNGVSEEAGTGDCLLLGRMLVFSTDSSNSARNFISSYPVTGTLPAGGITATSTSGALDQMTLKVALSTPDQLELPWGSYVTGGVRDVSPPSNQIDAVAYLRSPISSQVEAYVFKVPGSARTLGELNASFNDAVFSSQVVGPTATANSTGRTATICLASPDGVANQYRGFLKITPGVGAATISTGTIGASEAYPC